MESFTTSSTSAYTIRLTLLDGEGFPTQTYLDIDAVGQPRAGISSADVCAWLTGVGFNPSSEEDEVVVLPDTTDLRLCVSRTGFSGYDTYDTDFTISITDPDGVLAGLATSLTIFAGEDHAETEFATTSISGTAEIEISCGAYERTIEVVTGAQSLTVPRSSVTLPVNGTMHFPLHLDLREGAERTVTVQSSSAQVLSVVEERAEITFYPAMTVQYAGVEAVSQGSAQITIASPDLTAASLDVAVVPAEVVISSMTIDLSNLSSSNGGTVLMGAPEGCTFAQVSPPVGSEAYLAVEGEGEGSLVLEFVDGMSRPANLQIGIALQGAPQDDFEMDVWDLLHNRYFSYFVQVD